MKWTEFSEELWERMSQGAGILDKETHAWAVEQCRKLQRWNEEIREEMDEARRLAEKYHAKWRGARMPTEPLPWQEEGDEVER